MTIKLSQLMLNLYVLSHAESFSRHTVDMHPLCEYYNLNEPQDGRLHKKQTNIRTADVLGSIETSRTLAQQTKYVTKYCPNDNYNSFSVFALGLVR